MTPPPPDAARAVVTMWAGPESRPPNIYLYPAKWEAGCVEYRALPAAAFDALKVYAETGEAVECVLIEANEDDGTMTPADVVRALLSRIARAESALREAVGSEREACAKVAHAGSVAAFEQMANDSTDSINPSHTHADAMEAIGKALAECETIIRSRTALGAKGGGE